MQYMSDKRREMQYMSDIRREMQYMSDKRRECSICLIREENVVYV